MAGITKRTVDALKPGGEVFDSGLPGFGAKRQKDAVSYFVRYRDGRGRAAPKRYVTIGIHGALGAEGLFGPGEPALPWTPETAKRYATILLGKAKAGGDPAAARRTSGDTVAALCDAYVKAADGGLLTDRRGKAKKASTLKTDGYRIEAHIKPLLGGRRVADLTRADIEGFLTRLATGKLGKGTRKAKPRGKTNARGGKGTATRTTGLLGAILAYGVKLGLRPDNPAWGVQRFADGRKERRLNADEYRALGDVLADPATVKAMPHATAIVRLLALTGWRRGEVVGLKWADVDLTRRTARLSDTKTGRSVRPLSRAACDVLGDLTRVGDFVFPAETAKDEPAKALVGFPRQFLKLRALAGLPGDVTPHVLRHSFASAAADLGYSDATIGALVGHRGQTITSRYTHAADAVLVSAADAVAAEIAAQMFGTKVGDNVLTFTKGPAR